MEFGIAAALSGDPKMQAAYRSGDVYLEFAKQAGAAPADATKDSHESLRDMFKTVVLGTQYTMGKQTLAGRIGGSRGLARDLLRLHHETYSVFWRWSDAAVDHAMLHNEIHTVFGWTLHIGENPNARSIRNFPMQANGAECMRIAACLIAERGVPVGAVAHDAFGICSRLEDLEMHKKSVEGAMREASRAVLGGFELDVEIKTVAWPNRYMDKRGTVMWAKVTELLERQGRKLRKAG
jgi:DNA polymerase I-like protein with 3'-5' exonuclease and polymerase domains